MDTTKSILKGLYLEMSQMNFQTRSQFYAKPAHIVDPHDFYLMPYPYIKYLPSLNKPGDKSNIKDIKQGDVVIYASETKDLNKYFKVDLDEKIRGTIKKINEDKTCDILAVEYGFVEKNVSLERLYHPMYEEAHSIPPLTLHCELDMCAPKGPNFSEEAKDSFKFFIGNEKLSVVVKGREGKKLKVAVYNSNPDDIATLLALTNRTYLLGNILQSQRNGT